MKAAVFASLLLLVQIGCIEASSEQAVTNPIQKAMQLLSGLESKIQKDADQSRKNHDDLMVMCSDGKKDKGFAIITAKNEIEDLTATIEKAKSDIATETSRIDGLAGAISQNEVDLKAATTIRKNESAEFIAAESELVEVVGTLDRAINILDRKMKGSALMQARVDTRDVPKLLNTLKTVVDAISLSIKDRHRLLSLVQGGEAEDADSSDEDMGAPAADVYRSHSEGIIDVLEDLRQKAESQLSDLRREETQTAHNYNMLKQSLEDQVKADTKEMGQAKMLKAGAQETLSTSEGDLHVTQKTLADTENSLEALNTTCSSAEEDYAAAVASRNEELTAIAEAKKVLAQMTGGAEATVYGAASLFQTSHAQWRANGGSSLATRADLANIEVVNLLHQLARKENSPALATLASRVAAVVQFGAQDGEDPFAKVKSLIKDMVQRLEKEAGEEAKHKAWCDEQLGDTLAKKGELQQTIESLSAKIDKQKSEAITLKDEVKEIQSALSEIAKTQAQMDKVRMAEHETFVQTKTDLEQGLKGVRTAVKILREYYAEAKEVAHEKATGSGTSIIGMLEVVESDLSKSLAESELAEDSAAAAYQKVSMMNKINKASYEKDVEYKTKEAASLDKSTAELSSDRESSQTELDTVLEYSKSIQGACELKPESYDERKSRREAEVAGLKQALEILEGESVLLQRSAKLRGTSITRHTN